MKCESCGSDINPQWAHAIEKNICPFCGSSIMDEHLKSLFSTLRNTMKQLENYGEQLNDWMFSNYNYIKTDSPNLVDFVPEDLLKNAKKTAFAGEKKLIKVKNDDGTEQEVIVEKIQSDEKTAEYLKRAGVIRNSDKVSVEEKNDRLKKLAQQIRKEGISTEVENFVSYTGDEEVDPEAVMQMQAELDGGLIGADSSEDGEEILGLDVVMQMAGSGGKGNQKDLMKLKRLEANVKNSQVKFKSGNGGFSRS